MKYTTALVLGLLMVLGGYAQTAQITLGPDEIGENQPWTISLTVSNDHLKSYENFPDIDGFQKRGTSSSTQTSIVNGQVSSTHSIIQTYVPVRQGVVTVPALKMKVNDQVVTAAGKKVKVGPPVQAKADPFRSFFERDTNDFFGRGETEFVDVKEDALLALTTNKDEVYSGEGFTATLSFLVADNNRAPMQFYELGKQLSEILKKIKPANCWEENFNIENIEGEQIIIGGKAYTQYKIYEAAFYPLNAQPITIPSIGLEMIKFKVAKNPSFFGQNRKEDFKKFYTKPKTIRVKELPPHPLRDVVAVGDYKLEERINGHNLNTGQSTGYEFNIFGEGNISAIEKPLVKKDNNLEFYEPNIRQGINRQGNRVTGTKSFAYFMIPKEPGSYNLGDYVQWVYFNIKTKKYDTLRSAQNIVVEGESHKNMAIESNNPGSFYDQIDNADNTVRSASGKGWTKIGANVFILLMLGASVYFVFKK